MELIFLSPANEDYLYWQTTNEKTLKRINELIKQCKRTPFEGLGKPEPLKGSLSGWWSRRIDYEQRLKITSFLYFSAGNIIDPYK